MPDSTQHEIFSDEIPTPEKPSDGLESQIGTQPIVKPSKNSWFSNLITSTRSNKTAKIAVVNSPPIKNLLNIKVPQDKLATAIIKLLDEFSKLFNEIQTDIVKANKSSTAFKRDTLNNDNTDMANNVATVFKKLKRISTIADVFITKITGDKRKDIFNAEMTKINDTDKKTNIEGEPRKTILSTIFGNELRDKPLTYLYYLTINKNDGDVISFKTADIIMDSKSIENPKDMTNDFGPHFVFTNIFRLACDEYTKAYDDVMTGTPAKLDC